MINSNITTSKKAIYPCLKIARVSHAVVLYTAPKIGTVVSGVTLEGKTVGFYSDHWDDSDTTLFEGVVALQNA